MSAWLRKLWGALAIAVFSVGAQASVGYREIALPGTTMGVWFPSDEPAQVRKLGPFELNYAFDGAPRAGQWPLIVFSHGVNGRYRNHYLSLQALAQAGFVVAAPQHTGDKDIRTHDFQAAFASRVSELAHAVAAVRDDPVLGAVTRTDVVHGLGYSLGGATVLAAAGAVVDEALVKSHCRQNAAEDLDFCSDTPMMGLLHQFKRLFSQTAREDTLKAKTAPMTINGAVALVAPIGQGLIMDPTRMGAQRILDVAVQGDVIAPPRFHADVIAQALPGITTLVRRSGHHYAFISPIPKWALGKDDYFIINDPEGFDRLAFIDSIHQTLVPFFSQP